MRKFIIILMPLLLGAVGCSTDSQSRDKLYQSYINCVAQQTLTLHLLDQGEQKKLHELTTAELTFRLSDLQELTNGVDKDLLETGAHLAHIILKNADEHREQLIQDPHSLQMVTACKNLVKNSTDIQLASDLARYLQASSTNQIVYPTP